MADVSPGGPPDPSAPTQAVPYPGAPGYQGYPAYPAAPGPDSALAMPPALGPSPRRRQWDRILPIAGVILFLAAGAISLLIYLGVKIGITDLLVGLGAAVIPVPLLVAAFMWLDRYEPEPVRHLAFCFAWGAAIATGVALLVNNGASKLFDSLGLSDALVAVLVAPFIEESMKALGPILLFWRRRSEWSGITDGIVYCGMSAVGFAMVENILYLGKHGYGAGVEEYGPASGLQNLFLIFIVRILFTGFAHPLFTSMTGIGLGISARSGDRRVRWLAPIAGLLVAMILHGTFNLLPTLAATLSQPLIMLYGYVGFMVPFFFAAVGFAIALRGWEGRLTERVLPLYVRTGWFSPPEVASLGSLGRRHSARQWAERVAGPVGQRAMRDFQFAATQLALLRDGMQRGLHRKPEEQLKSTTEEHRLLTELQSYRQEFTAKDPTTPQAFWDGVNYHIVFPDGIQRTLPAPADPVVPVPIRLPVYSPYAPAYTPPGPGYGPPGYANPGYGPPGYAGPGYAPPGYAGPGYAAPNQPAPGYGYPPPPGYPAPPPFAQPPYPYPSPSPSPTTPPADPNRPA